MRGHLGIVDSRRITGRKLEFDLRAHGRSNAGHEAFYRCRQLLAHVGVKRTERAPQRCCVRDDIGCLTGQKRADCADRGFDRI